MKPDIHPDYVECHVKCACGNEFVTHATVPKMRLDICAKCHPFFTGTMKFVDTAGRVEKFQRKYANWSAGKPTAADGAEQPETVAAG